MKTTSRREFLVLGGAALVTGTFARETAPDDRPGVSGVSKVLPFEMGIASYTFRSFPLETVIEATARLGMRNVTLKEMHLPLQSSESEIAAVVKKISSAGLRLVSAGVVYMKSEEEVRRAFAYARVAGLKFLVGVPEPPLLGIAEQCVKETDIALAIHNHGPTDKRFPSPESVCTGIAGMDKRMGLCLDIGHTQRLGLDPTAEFERFQDRVLDIHFKDVSSADASGKTIEIGRGVIDIPKFLRSLIKAGYSRTVHFEFEKDQNDPMPGLAESVGYSRGVLATL